MYVDVSKAKSASISEIFQNSDLHEVFEPENDPKRSWNTPEGKVPTYFWEVINMWIKVVRGLIWAQIRSVRANWV